MLISLHLPELEQLMWITGLFVFEDAKTKDKILWQKCGIINARSQAGFKCLLPHLQDEQEKLGQSFPIIAEN